MENSTVTKEGTSEQETSQSDETCHLESQSVEKVDTKVKIKPGGGKRIDLGIKRIDKLGRRQSAPMAVQHREKILDLMSQGKMVSEVAESLGVTGPALSMQLASDPAYQAARQHGAQARLDQQYLAIIGSEDALTLARAREGWRAASWFAEREFPERWGMSNKLTVQNDPLSQVDRSLLQSANEMLELYKARMLALRKPLNDKDDGT